MGKIPFADGGKQFVGTQTGKNSQREIGTHARSGNKKFKGLLLARGLKTEQADLVFANVGMNQKLGFRPGRAQRSIGGKRNLHLVADTVHVHQHLGGLFLDQAAAQKTDHAAIIQQRSESVNGGGK